jgi:hypothetical protein
MFEVKCPQCNNLRLVKAKKPWMQGDAPYSKICKICCQVGKEKTKEHCHKLSVSAKAHQTDEVRKCKSEFMKSHPELWQNNLIAGQGAGWNEGLELEPRSRETKAKISQSMKNRKGEQ